MARNRLDVEPDLRYCLAVTQPRIQKLVALSDSCMLLVM